MVETMRYLAILPPSPTSKEPRHRDVETTADLAIGDELFPDELAFRVIELIPPPKDTPARTPAQSSARQQSSANAA